jgi:hypothetical protein
MHQYWHAAISGHIRHQLHCFRIALDMEFLFADSNRPGIQKLFQNGLGFWYVRQFVCEKNEVFGVGFGERYYCVIPAAPGRKTVFRAGRKQNCFSNSHRALMLYQLLICAPGVVCVLVNIEHGFGALYQRGRDQAKKRPSRE